MTDPDNNSIVDSDVRLFSVGGPIERVKVTLRIFGEELDPDEISKMLRCEPTHQARKGDTVAADNKGHQRVSPFGIWGLNSMESEDVDLEEQVLKLEILHSSTILPPHWDSLSLLETWESI